MKTLELNIDNATLVQECRSGDRDAMSILYTRFAPRMLRVISRYVIDKDSAQDILHDGFIAAFTRLDTLHDPDRLDFWLATIMKNLSLKFLQAQSVTTLLDEIGEDTLSECADDAGCDIDFAIIESLIRQLPEGYQKVFRLAVLEGKSHKEISEILGIAPNSSSSQLFHAKLRLRQLIKDYQLRAGLISILLLIVSTGIIFLGRHTKNLNSHINLTADATPKKQTSSHSLPLDTLPEANNSKAPATMVASKVANTYATSIPSIHIESDTSEDSSTLLTEISEGDYSVDPDSIAVSIPTEERNTQPSAYPEEDLDSFYDRLFAEAPGKSSSDKGWSAGISVDPGLLSFNSFGGDAVADAPPAHDPNYPPTGPDDEDTPPPSRMASQATDTPESYLGTAARHHYLPISFALTAEKRFSPWLGIESGIGYSYLHSDFERYSANGNEVSTCHWHYLEVPLKVNLYAYSNPRFKLYCSFGGRIALPVYAYASIPTNPYCKSGSFDSKTLWSVGGSLGMAFRLSKRVDLFIEPSLHYHFPQNSALPNIWTDDEPWSISIPIGFRLNW
ncbi:MAG: sigma-70 family RNA polymerase sigma factor [Muribaculaceae bacterium]|nr:sigma-70 family RNA polymerase sigma factor [Muribaculaceae bacterium]